MHATASPATVVCCIAAVFALTSCGNDAPSLPDPNGGLVYTELAAPLLGVRPGERVLDVCAAPGGKTAHLLELAISPGS